MAGKIYLDENGERGVGTRICSPILPSLCDVTKVIEEFVHMQFKQLDMLTLGLN